MNFLIKNFIAKKKVHIKLEKMYTFVCKKEVNRKLLLLFSNFKNIRIIIYLME